VERDYKLDFLRALAILGVLVIHSAARYAHSEIEGIIGGWFDLVARPCIAIFLFVSGVLFRKSQDISYLKHRVKRVLYPYLFFSMLALVYKASFDLGDNIDVVLLKILTGGTFNMYFFAFVIICIYIIVFILDKLGILSRYMIILFLVSLMINLLHASYFRQLYDFFDIKDKWKDYYYLRSLLIWFPYYFFGIYYRSFKLEKIILENKILIRVIWVSVLAFYSFLHLANISNIDGYNSVIATIYSLTTILFLLTFNVRNRAMYFISKISYSLYLSHIFFVYTLRDVARISAMELPFWFGLISLILSFIGSLFVYYIAKLMFKSRSIYIIGA
jgi:surface polysaccharide O-acyltransferase-like enzyme